MWRETFMTEEVRLSDRLVAAAKRVAATLTRRVQVAEAVHEGTLLWSPWLDIGKSNRLLAVTGMLQERWARPAECVALANYLRDELYGLKHLIEVVPLHQFERLVDGSLLLWGAVFALYAQAERLARAAAETPGETAGEAPAEQATSETARPT